MALVRYRTGVDSVTGQVLTGWPHCVQSLHTIWGTRVDSRFMRLSFGATIRDLLGEDITPALALKLYTRLVEAAHTWEPEYRLSSLQLVKVTQEGGLGVKHAGVYYPEGRLGNYAIAVPTGAIAAKIWGAAA